MSYGLQLRTTTGMKEVGAISTIIFMGRQSTDNFAGSVGIVSGWNESNGYFDVSSRDMGVVETIRVSGGSLVWDKRLLNSVPVYVDFWLVGSLS